MDNLCKYGVDTAGYRLGDTMVGFGVVSGLPLRDVIWPIPWGTKMSCKCAVFELFPTMPIPRCQ